MPSKISEAEWQVMKLLWQKSPRTANNIVEHLENITRWNRQTIRTLINRLVKKKAISFNKEGRVYHYFPVLSEKDCQTTEGNSFISRVYNGAVQPMLASFIENTDLSEEEIRELENILKNKRDAK
jgi:BlaI family penicillinase repressor